MPKILDRRLLGLIAVPLLHAPAPLAPSAHRARPVAPPPGPVRVRRPRPPLTLARLSVLEEDIVRLRYELAIAKLRHELSTLRPRPRPIPPLPEIRPVVQETAAVRPVPPSWRVFAIVGRAGNLEAVVGRRDGRRTVTDGSALGRDRVVRVTPAGVLIEERGERERLPVAVCGVRIGCPRSTGRPR